MTGADPAIPILTVEIADPEAATPLLAPVDMTFQNDSIETLFVFAHPDILFNGGMEAVP